MLDMLLSSATFMGTSWLEAAGATAAENAALRWLAEQAGLPPSAGGVFLPGGTMANLNALAVAAHQRRLSWRDGSVRPLGVATTAEAHSSVRLAAQILDQAVIPVGTDARGKMTAGSLTEALDHASVEVCAVVATAGQTNSGVIDDLSGVADVCAERGVWLHVDGSYGGAALLSARTRELLSGIERADSLAIDPHKWLFSPLDCSALLYRDPSLARLTFTQRAEYIEALRES
jgi:glutamate/tyrosine decarboxylase-like PLP-dependent enzyme